MDNQRFTHPKLIKQDRDIKYRLEQRTAQRKVERNKILEQNRNLNVKKEPASEKLNGTYTVPENEKGGNRRKLLDLWRKERDQKLQEMKPKAKPVFKVGAHVEPKKFELKNTKPSLCQTLSASRANLSTMSNVHSNNNTFPSTLRTGPLTRSLSKKITQTVETVKSMASNIKTFADQAKAASKFTFSALLVKKTAKPFAGQASKMPPPLPKPTHNNAKTHSSSNLNKNQKKASNDEFLVVSTKLPASLSSNSISSMQYEDFCGELFKKNTDIPEEDEFTYEAATLEAPPVVDTAVHGSASKSKTKSSRSSYRKSRSGMYKVDIQSSILELDDCDHRNDVETAAAAAAEIESKLETIVENVAHINLSVCETKVATEVKVEEVIVVDKIFVVEDDDFYELDGQKRDVKFYRQLVVDETRSLNECSAKWDNCIDDAPDDVQGDIRSAIGLAKLLIDERFTQFIELVDQCEFKTGDKLVKCSDLQGFWDMVDYQVLDVKKKFGGLERLKANNFVEEFVQPVRKATAKAATKEKKPQSAASAIAAAKRSKFAEFKAQMLKTKQQSVEEATTPDSIPTESPAAEQDKENNMLKLPLLLPTLANTPRQNNTPLKPIECNNSVQLKSIEKNIVFKYQTRSRASELIKLDAHTPKNNFKKFQVPSIAKQNTTEDEDDDDFFSLNSIKPITWRNSVANHNEIHIDLAGSVNINLNVIGGTPTLRTPATPKNRRSIFSAAQTCNTNDVAKSPLLKLVYISSHGKRLSRSGQI